MILEIEKLVGKQSYKFQFEGKTLFDCLIQSNHVSFSNVFTCGNCKSDILFLKAYKTEQGYEYIKICCGKCKAQATMGKTKTDGAYFIRRDEAGQITWEQYKPQGSKDEDPPF